MSIDQAWDNVFRSRVWGTRPHRNVIVMLAQNFYWADRAQVKILDLGCGYGSNTWYCAAEGYHTYAIDGSPTAIDKTRELLSSINKVAELRQGDIERLPYDDDMFDLVIDVATISCNNAKDSARIYKEVARVMKPGGLLYTQCFAPGTDKNCFAEGTYNRISSWKEMQSLFGALTVHGYDKIARRSHSHVIDKDVDVVEWMVSLKK